MNPFHWSTAPLEDSASSSLILMRMRLATRQVLDIRVFSDFLPISFSTLCYTVLASKTAPAPNFTLARSRAIK